MWPPCHGNKGLKRKMKVLATLSTNFIKKSQQSKISIVKCEKQKYVSIFEWKKNMGKSILVFYECYHGNLYKNIVFQNL